MTTIPTRAKAAPDPTRPDPTRQRGRVLAIAKRKLVLSCIASDGAQMTAKRIGVSITTLMRAAAGVPVLRGSVSLLLAGLAPRKRRRTNAAAAAGASALDRRAPRPRAEVVTPAQALASGPPDDAVLP
jgi:hypothetical protein